MLDRYDPRDEERARGDAFGREISQGSRGATDKRTPSAFEDRDGWERHEDLEVVTPHYRGAHAASARSSGFTCYVVGTGHSGGRGGRGRRAGFAEEVLG